MYVRVHTFQYCIVGIPFSNEARVLWISENFFFNDGARDCVIKESRNSRSILILFCENWKYSAIVFLFFVCVFLSQGLDVFMHNTMWILSRYFQKLVTVEMDAQSAFYCVLSSWFWKCGTDNLPSSFKESVSFVLALRRLVHKLHVLCHRQK